MLGARRRRWRNKKIVINHLGGKCGHCGVEDIRVLTVDHIDNDGVHDKWSTGAYRQTTATWYAQVVDYIRRGLAWPRRLQVLCFNCHAIKDLTGAYDGL